MAEASPARGVRRARRTAVRLRPALRCGKEKRGAGDGPAAGRLAGERGAAGGASGSGLGAPGSRRAAAERGLPALQKEHCAARGPARTGSFGG